MVRAYSHETERPYYDIKFRLDLESLGKELFQNGHLRGGLAAAHHRRGLSSRSAFSSGTTSSFDASPRYGSVRMPVVNRAMRRCNSESVRPGQSMNIDTLESALEGEGSVLRSPRAGIRRKQLGGQRIDHRSREEMAAVESGFSNMHVAGVRRSKSAAGPKEMGVYRESEVGSLFDFSNSNTATATVHSSLQGGLVTCLNSKNTAKYRVGQPYRSGFIVGIDTRLNKIIVYCPHLPSGALMIMRSSSAAKYDRGFEVTTPRGKYMGLVHAIDDLQNLIVVNTSKGK